MKPGSKALAALLVTSTTLIAQAATAAAFLQTTSEDFEEGEAQGTLVTPPGQVEQGLKSRRADLDAGFTWTSALSRDGRTMFAGTGDPGRVYAVSVADGKVRLLSHLPEPWVTALVVESTTTLLAATTPGAKLYRINLGDGKWKEIARLQSEHIWSLWHDEKTDITYAATGAPGKLATIDASAKVRLLWDAKDQHVVALASDGKGGLLAGSSDRAIVYHVTAQGQARALHDFEASEVRALVAVGDAFYVAVNQFEAEGEPPLPGKEKGAKGTPVSAAARVPAAPGRLPRAGALKAKSAVYRMNGHGAAEPVLSLEQGYISSLAVDNAQHVYASVGSEGKVYRLDADRNVALVLDLPERQALTMQTTKRELLVGSGDMAAVFVAEPAGAKEAHYLSKVFDALRPANWGHLRYGSNAALGFQTRSGNTARPDDTWQPWVSLEKSQYEGRQQQGEGRVASAAARYVQYRLTLPEGGVLRDAALFYRAHNQRPRITELTFADPAVVDRRDHTAVLKLRWKVDNADADALRFGLAYKPEHEPVWRPLAPMSEGWAKAELDWNTEAVPDGQYVVRIDVSDAPSVPQDQALASQYVSPPLLIDNTRPAVTGLVAQLPVVSGRAVDAASPISHIEFSIDGGVWQMVTPEDGLLDQNQEAFRLRLPQLPTGNHVVAVRAFDSGNNAGVGQIVVVVK